MERDVFFLWLPITDVDDYYNVASAARIGKLPWPSSTRAAITLLLGTATNQATPSSRCSWTFSNIRFFGFNKRGLQHFQGSNWILKALSAQELAPTKYHRWWIWMVSKAKLMMTPKICDPGIRIATLVLGVKYGQQGGGRVDSGSYQQSRMVRTHVLPYTPHPPHKYTHIHTCCHTNKHKNTYNTMAMIHNSLTVVAQIWPIVDPELYVLSLFLDRYFTQIPRHWTIMIYVM